MERLFEYKGHELYCHHSIDETPEPTDFYMHTHEWHELYMFLSGNAGFLVEGCEYKLQPYDIMIMRKAEAHKLIVDQRPRGTVRAHRDTLFTGPFQVC